MEAVNERRDHHEPRKWAGSSTYEARALRAFAGER